MPKRFVVYQDNQSGLFQVLDLDQDKDKEAFDHIEDIASVPVFKTVEAEDAAQALQQTSGDTGFLESLKIMLNKKEEIQTERSNWVTKEELEEDTTRITICRQKIDQYRIRPAA